MAHARTHVNLLVGISTVLVLGLLFVALFKSGMFSARPGVIPSPETEKVTEAISFSKKEIESEYVQGEYSIVTGTSELALETQKYIDEQVDSFVRDAEEQVPQLLADFGSSSPVAHYEIDISAEEVSGTHTTSIVISYYTYTGGAHGQSSYKVFTADKQTGELIALDEIINPSQRNRFLDFIQGEILKEMGDKEKFLFPEIVDEITWNSFPDWALDSENFIMYFDQYEITAGAAGAFTIAIPRALISEFIQPYYQK